MLTAIWLLVVQGALGTFDTLWYHEWKVALHSQSSARRELALHSVRNLCYAALYMTLARWELHGAAALLVVALLIAELVITLTDFLEEDRTRKLPGGERVMHALIGIAWGAMLPFLLPELWRWWHEPLAVVSIDRGALAWVLTLMALGAAGFGVRDAYFARQQGARTRTRGSAPSTVGRGHG